MTAPVLYVLDVGHGSSAVLRDTHGTVVIDAGPKTSLLEFCRAEAITHVDVVLISHADEDHIDGLFSLIESQTVSIGKVRLNPDLVKDTKVWANLVWLLEREHADGRIDFETALTTRHSGQYNCGEVCIEVLAPSMSLAATNATSPNRRSRRLESNSRSVVVRLTRNGEPLVLLAGDIDEVGFDSMLQSTPNPQAQILVYPHHGGLSGANDEAAFAEKLCSAIKPSTVLFSIGRGKHETPRPEIVEAIRKLVPNVRVACTQLSTHCCLDHTSELHHLTTHFAVGRERRQCCAGTIAIRLSLPVTISPEEDPHIEFIRAIAPEGLCIRQFR
jgi:competence protein ComEC